MDITGRDLRNTPIYRKKTEAKRQSLAKYHAANPFTTWWRETGKTSLKSDNSLHFPNTF